MASLWVLVVTDVLFSLNTISRDISTFLEYWSQTRVAFRILAVTGENTLPWLLVPISSLLIWNINKSFGTKHQPNGVRWTGTRLIQNINDGVPPINFNDNSFAWIIILATSTMVRIPRSDRPFCSGVYETDVWWTMPGSANNFSTLLLKFSVPLSLLNILTSCDRFRATQIWYVCQSNQQLPIFFWWVQYDKWKNRP